tara:strand:+ start:270 stop:2135 length:1866 start_codon:yes stop_codon:yes gene_type:complete
MPFQKLLFKAGINDERTSYSSESGWYEGDKVRFRQGFPEKIGGWNRISTSTFQGVCRSLWNWVTLAGFNLVGVGTNLKFYLEQGGAYNDITPIRATTTNAATFAATNGSTTITVTDNSHGASVNDFVTFSGAVSLGGNITATILNAEHQITEITSGNTYTITVSATANSSDTGNGGGSVTAAYQITTGQASVVPLTGWGAGTWGGGTWGNGLASNEAIRLWSQSNFGEDLLFAVRGGSIYYWDATNGVSSRGVELTSLGGASDVPTVQNLLLVSDINRFVFCFGCNNQGSATQDPMLVRWSDQESAVNWTPASTNQAGGLNLSRGTEIVAAKQARQEVLVWSDSALYSMQYVGAPAVWGAQLVGDNISIASQNSVAFANGVAYWMGKDKFYKYDGRTQPLRCDVKRHIFNDINTLQYDQFFAGTSEAFHEIWWFYCSTGQTNIDRYAIYNYLEDTWYYGSLGRTAWLDSGLRNFPLAATYSNNLVNHEDGIDDNETGANSAITASISSSQFDIGDGNRFGLVSRVLPDMTFEGSTTGAPAATLTLQPMANSGSGYNSPLSESGNSSGTVTRNATAPIEQFTDELYVRVRGRQMVLKVESTAQGVMWQLGTPRLDTRPDGRR